MTRILGIPVPNAATLLRLFGGGFVGLMIWEAWARVLTNMLLGFPLEPAGLIDALAQHNLGLTVPWLLREAIHYAIGIIGYPVAYYVISRGLKNWSFRLDAVVAVTFVAAVGACFATGRGTMGLAAFLVVVLGFIATRFFNPNVPLRDSLAWGTFTWFNALGVMAPLGGLSFYALGDSAALSFMSFVGHVIYGAVAAWLFEYWSTGAATAPVAEKAAA